MEQNSLRESDLTLLEAIFKRCKYDDGALPFFLTVLDAPIYFVIYIPTF